MLSTHFIAGSEPGIEELCKQDWKTQLGVLERLVHRDEKSVEKIGEPKIGLDSAQIKQVTKQHK